VRPWLSEGSGGLLSNQVTCAADKAATFEYMKSSSSIWPERRACARRCFSEADSVVLRMIAAIAAICAWVIAFVTVIPLRLCPRNCHASLSTHSGCFAELVVA